MATYLEKKKCCSVKVRTHYMHLKTDVLRYCLPLTSSGVNIINANWICDRNRAGIVDSFVIIYQDHRCASLLVSEGPSTVYN